MLRGKLTHECGIFTGTNAIVFIFLCAFYIIGDCDGKVIKRRDTYRWRKLLGIAMLVFAKQVQNYP